MSSQSKIFPELDAGVTLRSLRRQDVEFDVELAAGVLELGHEFAAAVDLDGPQGRGEGFDDVAAEACGVEGGGSGEGAGDHESADGQMARNPKSSPEPP